MSFSTPLDPAFSFGNIVPTTFSTDLKERLSSALGYRKSAYLNSRPSLSPAGG